MKGLFSIQGGKSFQRKKIVDNFPKEYSVYVEPFVGAGSVFFEKPKTPNEIINDKDADTIFVYRMLQKYPSPPRFTVSTTTKEEFLKYKKMTPKNEVEKLEKILVLFFHSWRGSRESYAPSRASMSIKDSYLFKHWNEYHNRLKGVKIYNKDWKEVVSPYLDNANALIYLDPPYETEDYDNVTKAANRTSYYGVINLNSLILTLQKAKCKFMLSFSNHPELKKRLKEFNVKSYKTQKTIKN